MITGIIITIFNNTLVCKTNFGRVGLWGRGKVCKVSKGGVVCGGVSEGTGLFSEDFPDDFDAFDVEINAEMDGVEKKDDVEESVACGLV